MRLETRVMKVSIRCKKTDDYDFGGITLRVSITFSLTFSHRKFSITRINIRIGSSLDN